MKFEPACRRCIFWRRGPDDTGRCFNYARFEVQRDVPVTHANDRCERFEQKVYWFKREEET